MTCSNQSSTHDIQYVFNNLWSDNADELSLFYSSSPSLKTDYTRFGFGKRAMCRTGRRTIQGVINDGIYSAIRYMNNNFRDGYFEDCINLALNTVQMGPSADRHMKGLIKSTFMMFYSVILVFELAIISAFVFFAKPRLL